MLTPRRHGWQRPLHPLQFVGTAIFCFLAVAFYAFLGLFLGNRAAEITVTTLFSVVCVSVVFLFIRCTAIDPTDKTRIKSKKKSSAKTKLNTWKILCEIVLRMFRKLERKILRRLIRRKYNDPFPGSDSDSLDPFLSFPMVLNLREDSDATNPKSRDGDEEISFCPLCDFEVKKRSKHCRTCNRCVEGFDHHCRWLNNCVGKRNYTTFILLMIFVLLMLIMEAGTGIAIFVRCFTDKSGIEDELERKLYVKFPREVLATISALLVLMTSYGSAALGQLFFFHIILIRKGIRTYDYIMAMKEENQSVELDLSDDEDSDISSDESIDLDTPEKSSFVSRFICRGQEQIQNHRRLSIRIEGDRSPPPKPTNKSGFRVGIDPWKLIKLSKDKAVRAAEKARERIANQKPAVTTVDLKPLPLETKCGPADTGPGSTPLLSRLIGGGSLSPEVFSSPRRRFSSSGSAASPSPQSKYRSNFDLKLTDVSRELETYISRQVLSSVLKEEGSQPSPR